MFKNSTTNLALSNFIIALKKDKEILCSSVLTAPCLIHKPGHLDYGGSEHETLNSVLCTMAKKGTFLPVLLIYKVIDDKEHH